MAIPLRRVFKIYMLKYIRKTCVDAQVQNMMQNIKYFNTPIIYILIYTPLMNTYF